MFRNCFNAVNSINEFLAMAIILAQQNRFILN